GMRRRMESDVTVLPHPDSPTSPSVSPGCTSKETPSTARAVPLPCSVTKYVLRSRTRSRGSVTPPPCGVECVPQRVTHRVQRHDDQRDREPGEGRRPPRDGHLVPAVGDHIAPAGCRGGHAQAEEREP